MQPVAGTFGEFQYIPCGALGISRSPRGIDQRSIGGGRWAVGCSWRPPEHEGTDCTSYSQQKNAEAFLCVQKESAFSKVGDQGWAESADFKRAATEAGKSLIL